MQFTYTQFKHTLESYELFKKLLRPKLKLLSDKEQKDLYFDNEFYYFYKSNQKPYLAIVDNLIVEKVDKNYFGKRP